MRKKACIVILLIAAALLFLFALTRPRVWYVEGDIPGYSFPSPSPLTLHWRLSGKDPELVIVPPMSEVPETDSYTVLLARPAEEWESPDEVLLIDDSALWAEALSGAVECIVYDSSDKAAERLCSALLAMDSNAFPLSYESKVSAVNYDGLREKAEGAERVFLLTPSTSIYYARHTDQDVVLDFRDKAALESTYAKYTVSVDMDRLTEGLLSGKTELPFTLLVSKE